MNLIDQKYTFTSHARCIRNEYFEWKIDSKNFGEKEGCLFYIQGFKVHLLIAVVIKIYKIVLTQSRN